MYSVQDMNSEMLDPNGIHNQGKQPAPPPVDELFPAMETGFSSPDLNTTNKPGLPILASPTSFELALASSPNFELALA
ncbi:hypothetical protein FRC11_008939, partial [Ceratobasidium sp. 423]